MNLQDIACEIQKIIELNGGSKLSDDERMELIEQYFAENGLDMENLLNVPPTAEEYLELAMEAKSKRKTKEYLNKALALAPDNPEIQMQIAIVENSGRPDKQLPIIEKLIESEEEKLRQAHRFDECIGDFWMVHETRPYMRLRHSYFITMFYCGMYRAAIEEGKRILELCEGDNLGVRYTLMHLYAYTEDEMHALALHKQFESSEETQFLLPLAVLYYKMMRLDEAAKYLLRLLAVNKGLKRFVRMTLREDFVSVLEQHSGAFAYEFGTIEELLAEYTDNAFLFESVPCFFRWADEQLRGATAKKR